MGKKKILIVSPTNLQRDPRVLRQFEALKHEYEITTIGNTKISSEAKGYLIRSKPTTFYTKIKKALRLVVRDFRGFEKDFLKNSPIQSFEKGEKFDVVIINDVNALPYLKLINTDANIWLDMHEYTPKQFDHFWYWKYTFQPYYSWLLEVNKQKISTFTTVSNGIAEMYKKKFGLNEVQVITNAPQYVNLQPSKNKGVIKLVHHGVAVENRNLEKLIEVVKILGSGYSLDFYLMVNSKEQNIYLNRLKQLSNNLPISFHLAVATESIAQEINQYDIGVYILSPINFNHLHALPNKIFENVQARLALAFSPNPEMKRVIEENEIGVVSEGYSSAQLAEAISKLKREDIDHFKNNSDRIAIELSSNQNINLVQNIVYNLV